MPPPRRTASPLCILWLPRSCLYHLDELKRAEKRYLPCCCELRGATLFTFFLVVVTRSFVRKIPLEEQNTPKTGRADSCAYPTRFASNVLCSTVGRLRRTVARVTTDSGLLEVRMASSHGQGSLAIFTEDLCEKGRGNWHRGLD